MEFAAVIAALIAAYNHRDAAEDRQDAFVDTLMPEVAKYFTALFKGEEDSLFSALNSLVLATYHVAPDTLQFFIRLMANMSVEKLQGRWPAWVSLPIMVFVKGYFTALEEAAKDKAKPTVDDVKEAGRKAAAKAKDTADELGKKFKAAKEAAKGVNIPPDSASPPPPGGSVPHDSHAPPSGGARPAAGGTGDKSNWQHAKEQITELFAVASFIWEKAVKAAKRAEDLVQNLANGAVFVTGLLLITLLMAFCAVMSDNPRLFMLVIVVSSLAWVMGPFVGFHVWRRKARMIAAKTPKSTDDPHDEPGNGVLEGAGIVIVNLFVWGISTIVVAILCAIGAYAHFAWGYVWMGLISISIAYFVWILFDFVADGTKAIVHEFVKNGGSELRLKNRFARSFSLAGLIYCFAMILPVFNGVMNHTQYTWDVGIPGLFLALLSGFVNTRSGSPPSVLPADHAKNDWVRFSKAAYVAGVRMFLWAVVPTIALLLINSFVPPQCPDKDGDPKTVDVCETEELPSYSERIVAFVKKDAVNSATSLGNEVAGLVSTTAGVTTSTCSTEVIGLIQRIRWDDCKVALQESKDPEVLRLCKEAVSCGALQEDGAKQSAPVRKVGPSDAGFNWWYVGVPTAIALFLGLTWAGRKDPEAGKEKKEGAKPAAH